MKQIFIFLSLFLLISFNSEAQFLKRKRKKQNTSSNPIQEKTKGHQKYEGLFTLYQDTITGKIKMEIKKDQIDKEYIYFSQFEDGLASFRKNRGTYNSSKVIVIRKYFNKIEFVEVNTSSYFDPSNPISKARSANMTDAILASIEIKATAPGNSSYLIDAGSLFLSETFLQVKPVSSDNSPTAFKLGNLDKSKTKITAVRTYPENMDVAVEYVYSQPYVVNEGRRDVTDARNISLKVYHSLIAMPENDFTPLLDDPRVGFFTTQVTNMTSLEHANYRDLVHRWHLVKKNPEADLSEPVEPIVWWMENTTPLELRPLIKKAGEKWNEAFEKAGFKNAIVIKQQPDNADWDAGDIRYNVLRWTASPYPPFGGYGPSFVNPRTGQILGADIMFEYRSVLRRVGLEGLFQSNGHGHHQCDLEAFLAENTAFGELVGNYLTEKFVDSSRLIQEYIQYLVMHEIGHTLGLSHNMKASQLHSLETVHNKEKTEKIGLIGSVMDYPAINVARNPEMQGNYYTTKVGPYDLWAIQFAYEQGRTKEETEKLLNRSTEPELQFGNDADDMRYPGKGIDPRVNIFDLTNQAIEYEEERLDLVQELSGKIIEKYHKKGRTHHDKYVAMKTLMRQYVDASNIVSRYIGGIYVDRSMIGQKGASKQPYTPVDLATQKKAMRFIEKYLFDPNAFHFTYELYPHLAKQRRGFDFYSSTEDVKAHQMILDIQKNIFNHVLHPITLQRIIDTKLYGNHYTIENLFSDLTKIVFEKDIQGNVHTIRQNLQVEYVKRLISIQEEKSKYPNTAKSIASYQLKEILKLVSNNAGDISSKAHKQYIKGMIEKTFD